MTKEAKHMIVPIRFTPADLTRIRQEAEALRLSVPVYVRMVMTRAFMKEEARA